MFDAKGQLLNVRECKLEGWLKIIGGLRNLRMGAHISHLMLFEDSLLQVDKKGRSKKKVDKKGN